MTAPVQKLVTADGTYATQSAFSTAPTPAKSMYEMSLMKIHRYGNKGWSANLEIRKHKQTKEIKQS